MIIRPQDGQQMKAAQCPARFLVYGGGAGGGKTWFQAYKAGEGITAAKYRAVLFRRTYQMITMGGSLLDTCQEVYGQMGAESILNPPTFAWASGARVDLRHLQHAKNALDHKSAQYARIGMDEASDFVGGQFDILRSRLRTMSGVRKQFILTTNPDPDCFLREWIDWWIGSDGFPDPSRDGVIRYFVRLGDDIIWADDPADLSRYVDDPANEISSMSYIRSLVTDNQILLDSDPQYMAELKGLPDVQRARFLLGNWDVREGAGDFFQRGWFPAYGTSEFQRILIGQVGEPWRVTDSIRFWDLAGTPVKQDLVPGIDRPADFRARDGRTANPDWSVGVRVDRFCNGRRVIRDAKFYRDTPGALEQAIERTAAQDGKRTVIGLWQDPGQAGIAQVENLTARLTNLGYRVEAIVAVQSKEQYAREPSRAAYKGDILLEDNGDWTKRFFNQLEAFPKTNNDVKIDAVDALSGAELYFVEHPPPSYSGYVSATATPPSSPGGILQKPRNRDRLDPRHRLHKHL